MEKYDQLKSCIKTFPSLAVAFSGGVDSAVLLYAAADALGVNNVLAYTVTSPLHPKEEGSLASDFARMLGVRYEQIEADPLCVPAVSGNRRDRCYHCKRNLFDTIIKKAVSQGVSHIADGTNMDDLTVYRPGLRAIEELGVYSPLRTCGFHKNDIREISSFLELPQSKKPAGPCLATRVPYDQPLTLQILRQIEAGEAVLKSFGLSDCRLRHHGDLARIEIPLAEYRVILCKPEIINQLHTIGYRFVTLDLEGLRSGCYDDDKNRKS